MAISETPVGQSSDIMLIVRSDLLNLMTVSAAHERARTGYADTGSQCSWQGS